MLAAHPCYAQDFTPVPKVRNAERFQIGTAGYWPDIARSQPEYNRPNWHYQLGATLTMGDPAKYTVPETPGPCPATADLRTRDLYIAQAVELCRRVVADNNSLAGDRAIALCWIAHLVGDAHQPCHTGSMYVAGLFPEGDRGANSIPTKQKNNMHALWDSLLGERFNEGVMNRRVKWIAQKPGYKELGQEVLARPKSLEPLIWLVESREHSKEVAYTNEVLGPVKAAMNSPLTELLPINFSENYLKRAGSLAQYRAAEAGYRLAEVWREGLTGPSKAGNHDLEPFGDSGVRPSSLAPGTAEASPVLTHWLNTNGNVRHNSSCRWFEKTKRGRMCTAEEGKPCGICGG